jgi:AraC family transcriptional regulator of adaptative response/methylated-DNA-[protein]-cysteine methyltransferase
MTSSEAIGYVSAACSLGTLLLGASERGICWLTLGDEDTALLAQLRRRWPHRTLRASAAAQHAELAYALQWVEQPGGAWGPGPAIDLVGTDFQHLVWQQLRAIPPGSVISYAELARRVGRPRSYRAVAQACGANPVAVLVPCHRVIASDGRLGGFGLGLARKAELLRREGVNPRPSLPSVACGARDGSPLFANMSVHEHA